MENFDRSKYKGASIASVKKVSDDAKRNSTKFNDYGGDYVDFFIVKDGANWLRVAPAHDPNDSPYIPVRTTMLKCSVEKRDAEKNIIPGEFEIKNKKIFIAPFHCERDENNQPIIKKDVVEVYIGFVIRQAEQLHGKGSESFKKYLNPVNGYRASGKWVSGIKPSTNFVCYGWDDNKDLERAELYEGWMKRMNEISLQESSGDGVLALDVFSDPDTGLPLSITKGKDEKGNTKYTLDAVRNARGESWEAFFKRCNPSDEMLMKFSEVKTLKELYIGVYTKRDFDLAMDGLQRFDTEHGYNIFANDDFMDEVEAIAVLVPEKKEKEEKEETKVSKPTATTSKPTSTATTAKTEVKKEAVSTEKVTPLVMKKFLRTYITENYGADFQLPTTLSGEELVEWYNLAQANDELPFPASEETTENEIEDTETNSEESTEEQPEAEEPVKDDVTKTDTQAVISTQDRLKLLREKQMKAAQNK